MLVSLWCAAISNRVYAFKSADFLLSSIDLGWSVKEILAFVGVVSSMSESVWKESSASAIEMICFFFFINNVFCLRTSKVEVKIAIPLVLTIKG